MPPSGVPAFFISLKMLNNQDKERPLRIWMVDDNADFLHLQSNLLDQEPGVKCECLFSSAPAALAALAKEIPPDAILLDVEMPDMSGIEAIRPILEIAPATSVVMLTTFFSPIRRQQAFSAGASGFLLKRTSIKNILAAVVGQNIGRNNFARVTISS
jgi:DNA-binding NarL/FixJ family response regulator